MTLSIEEVKAGVVTEHLAFADFVKGFDDEQWTTPSRCEGWTCADVAAHVIGGMVDVVEGRLDGLGSPEVTAREVEERRGRTPVELADELVGAIEQAKGLVEVFDADAWASPSPGGFEGTLLQGVEALYYDAYLHADDIRAATGLPSERGEGLRAAVHHVAFELEKRGWGPATLALDDVEVVDVGDGGDRVTGDALQFVLAATGRADPKRAGFEGLINIYAE